MSKREELVKAIGERVIDELFKLEKDYDYEADECGFYSASYSIGIRFEYGNCYCDIDCSVWWYHGKPAIVECLLYGSDGKKVIGVRDGKEIHESKKLECLEKAVGEYLDEHLDTDELRSVMEDDLREASMDEFQRNGFASAADYYHWRYSA